MRIAKNIFLGLVCVLIFTPVLTVVFILILGAFAKATFANLLQCVSDRYAE